MRILYFTRDYTPHDYRFLTSLAKTDHTVFSLRLERRGVPRETRPLPDQIEQVTWKGGQREANWKDYPALLRDLKRVLNTVQPHILHAGTIQTGAFLAALSGFRPLVSMSWGSDLLKDADQNAWMRWVTRYTLNHSTILIGDCKAVRDKAVEFGFPAKRTVIFPWGIDLEHFQPGPSDQLRQQLGWDDCFVMLSLRSWEPIYGVELLVRAFIRAARIAPDLRLLLLGDGSQAGLIKGLLAESGVEDRVHIAGHAGYADLPDYYRAADLYASASYSDGSSISLLEALACGRPALVSDIPGNREWIEDGEQGWFFKTGDEDELVAAILKIYDQRMWLARMSSACRKLAEERADWNKNFHKLLRAYDAAVRHTQKQMIRS